MIGRQRGFDMKAGRKGKRTGMGGEREERTDGLITDNKPRDDDVMKRLMC